MPNLPNATHPPTIWSLSVTSISSHSFEVRGLKFGKNNPYMNGSKSTEQNFDGSMGSQKKLLYHQRDFFIQLLKLFKYWTAHFIHFLEHRWFKKLLLFEGEKVKFWSWNSIPASQVRLLHRWRKKKEFKKKFQIHD